MTIRLRRVGLPALQGTIAVALAAGVLSLSSSVLGGAQSAPQANPRAADWAQRSKTFEETGLAEPFKGITTDGTVVPTLFAARSTGVSTAPVVKAAQAFLAALSEPQRSKTLFAVDDPEWRKWMNQHFYIRQGVGFDEMSAPQREAAFGLLEASLSAKGLTLTRDIMRLNHTLGELNDNDFVQYGEWFYWITVMGTPSATKPWGWQIDGHHVIINYYVQGDQVVMTPTFVGSEPVTATSGKYAGTSVLQDQQNKALAFMQSLDAGARAKATVAAAKTRNDNRTEAFKDNVVMPYQGVKASELPPAAQAALADLIGLYVGIQDDGHAGVKMREVKAHLADTYFSWVGATTPDAVFYYRIHSPVVLIEFDHQTPIAIRLPDGSRGPTRQHIHAVMRTPNGNDYGKDLLRQHLLAQH
ncbi:MAG: DUF3500 domain-containing protein [Vicinamibacteraceae bacterium]